MTKEADLAARVVLWLRLSGWEVYAEVDQVPGRGKARADIVAVTRGDDPQVWAIECKPRLGWDALGQAAEWREYAHVVSVATELGPSGPGLSAALAALEHAGLGWLQVAGGEVRQRGAPPSWRTPPRVSLLLDALRPEHALARPGTAGGSRPWTEWDERARRLAEVVAAEPGVTLVRALRLAEVHLDADGRRALVRQLRLGLLPGVAMRREGRAYLLTSAEECF